MTIEQQYARYLELYRVYRLVPNSFVLDFLSIVVTND